MPSLQNPPVDGGRLPDTRERQRIARELTIILQQNGLLESAIRTAAQKQALTIEEIVRQRLAAGGRAGRAPGTGGRHRARGARV